MLALALGLVGMSLTARRLGPGCFVAGVLLINVSIFTKQTNVLILLGVLALWIRWSWRRALLGAVLSALLIGCTVLALQLVSDGWFGFYTFELPGAAQRIIAKMISFYLLLGKGQRDPAPWRPLAPHNAHR